MIQGRAQGARSASSTLRSDSDSTRSPELSLVQASEAKRAPRARTPITYSLPAFLLNPVSERPTLIEGHSLQSQVTEAGRDDRRAHAIRDNSLQEGGKVGSDIGSRASVRAPVQSLSDLPLRHAGGGQGEGHQSDSLCEPSPNPSRKPGDRSHSDRSRARSLRASPSHSPSPRLPVQFCPRATHTHRPTARHGRVEG